jgi:hypothetical protein
LHSSGEFTAEERSEFPGLSNLELANRARHPYPARYGGNQVKPNAGILLLLAVLLVFSTAAYAQELKVGDAAPDFTLPASDGQTYTLSKLKGKTVVLAWFPKAFTGG